ncbi:MAG: acyltransferase [Actinophytocola sp.]|nr:acyltransferase [Actinophytocola sp.]
MRIALCQITGTAEPAANLELVRAGVARAAAEEATVAVFPEATMAKFGTPLRELAEPIDGPWATEVATIAEQAGVLVVAGMFTPADSERVHNTLLVTGRGQHLGYDKIHLYDAFGFRESRTVAAGDKPVTVEVDGATLGLATCYDVRFPELFQALADAGASAVAVPASWGAGKGKLEQWELLIRARALDAGCWVLGADQADPAAHDIPVDPKIPTGIGHSLAADPFGNVHARLGAAAGTLVTELDLAVAESSRHTTAVLANRRLGRS